jgi:CheY-like chemotaxis protein
MEVSQKRLSEFRRAFLFNTLEGVFFQTADGLPGHREKCLQAGMHDFLLKPFMIEELHEKLCFWLRRREH